MRWEVLAGIITGVVAAAGAVGGGMYKLLEWWGNRSNRRVDAIDKLEQVVGRFAGRIEEQLAEADGKLAECGNTISELRDQLRESRLMAANLLELIDEAASESGVDPAKAARWRTQAMRHRLALQN